MKCPVFLIGFALLTVPVSLDARTLDRTCTITTGAVIHLDEDGDVTAEVQQEESQGDIVFKDLDTDTPTIHRGKFHQILQVLRREPTVYWMARSQDLGRVQYWTFYLRQNVVILSQHDFSGQVPVGRISMGKCR